jgi:serine-type D-Ala-D-Ala carboxypeptidase/endopeptidase (penicillin-binding protein 4)
VRSRARAFVLLTNVALFSFAGACAPKSAAPPTQPAAARLSAEDQLRRDLQSIFSDPAVDHAVWAISVKSLKSGETLFALNPARLLTPASTQKVITSAVAAERLGWDFRYSTRIYATGPVDSIGDLNGDLIVVSDGDPTINPRHPERWGAFDAWAKQIYARGIRRVGGQLIGDDNAFAEPGWGVGWAWDDLSTGYGAAVGGLQYNENQLELLIGPGVEPGARAIISVSPPGSGVILDHGVTTVAQGEPSRVTVERIPGSNMLSVRGQMAVGAPAVNQLAAVPNPTTFYLNALREALARNGVFVGGNALDVDDARVKPDYATATLLVEDQSAPLESIIDVCLKWSRNDYAETMLHSLAPAGAERTAAAGLTVVTETLLHWGVRPELFVARDGSGLSRNDYLAPDALIAVLTRMWLEPRHAAKFRSALPQAAVSGSLANRMKETVAAERVHAKTGSMSNVRTLAGYATTLDGEPIVFAMMANGFSLPASRIDAAMDEALVRLVTFPRALHEE